MSKKTRTKTTITKEIIEQVEELAEQGFNNILIGQSLNIATQTLSTNTELKEAIQRGKLELSKKVTSTILEALSINATNQQFLVKRLGLFTPEINIKKPNNAKEALENLANATKQFADGAISESQLRTIEAVSNSYTKNFEITELEERIQALEEKVINEK
jgi:gas vesicle protein